MRYWRMQLHPGQPALAAKHAIESLAAGYIGLDFGDDPGDLMRKGPDELEEHKSYMDFARKMQTGDQVLIIVHDYPFALVKVKGDYNYIRKTAPEIGVWFKHFRAVDKKHIYYYADYVTNPKKWQKTEMPSAIQSLRSNNRKTMKLIKKWLEST